MKGLFERLKGWNSPFEAQTPSSPVQIQRVAIDIERKLGYAEQKKPPEFDLERSYQALRTSFVDGHRLADVGRRTLRHAPWVIFEPWGGEQPLGENGDFVDAYIDQLIESAAGGLISSFAFGLLMFYPRCFPTFDALRVAAKELLAQSPSPRCRRLYDCVKTLNLLESDGPVQFWHWFSEQRGSIEKRFQGTCLTGGLLQSGFLKAVFEEAVKAARSELGSPQFDVQPLDSLLLLATVQETKGKAFRFKAARSQKALAEALLLPFCEHQIAADVKEKIQEFVLNLYGDPRIDRSRWQGVDDAAIQVVLGWLVEDTLEDFFRLLEYLARGDEVATRHWHYRKAFWTAYLKKGVIHDAWIVLAPSLDVEARRLLGTEKKGYGRFKRGSGVLSNHGALILRMDHLVITDWSHSGKYRIWYEGTVAPEWIPKLYKPRYTRHQLIRGASEEGIHNGAENGHWQFRLADYVRNKTGIEIRYQEFMPR